LRGVGRGDPGTGEGGEEFYCSFDPCGEEYSATSELADDG